LPVTVTTTKDTAGSSNNNTISSYKQQDFGHLFSHEADGRNLDLSQNHSYHQPRNLFLLSELLILRQQQKNQSGISNREKEQLEQGIRSQSKRILLIDDNPDITLTFKNCLEAENDKSGNKTFFKVFTYNDTIQGLAEFRPNFYDLLLIDVNIPKMNGFEFSRKILELDVNVRVCYITAAEINLQALREQFPTLSIGCFIKKPIGVEDLVRRVKAELE
jgi:CheY-like chemotaxis protein